MNNPSVFTAIMSLPSFDEMAYRFYQVKPGIFLLEVNGNESLAMTFLRTQEFYESVNPAFQGKEFTLDEYKAWYKTQSDTGEFTYGEDWIGFNVPSPVIEECYRVNKERTVYDERFLSFCNLCTILSQEQGLDNYYLLGVRMNDTQTLDHEIAHGMFTVNQDYRRDMLSKVEQMDAQKRNMLYAWLTKKGYAKSVHDDEIQAFLATGLNKTMPAELLKQEVLEFEEVFLRYNSEDLEMSPLVDTINF